MSVSISVLVPVYKVEPYLRRCIDSVLEQDFQDWELILVDDGSPDNCPAICDEYAERDKRIRVIHKPNGGLVSARLAGFRECKRNVSGFSRFGSLAFAGRIVGAAYSYRKRLRHGKSM